MARVQAKSRVVALMGIAVTTRGAPWGAWHHGTRAGATARADRHTIATASFLICGAYQHTHSSYAKYE